ncbi:MULTISPECIES: LysR family transcriptional regulator [unclassified Caballeronia]|uniref:LysR family transcriptional regulator n=1 Tax=unclassified Caballeronia TaxID=2646786 RepID=UPI00025BC326|nr:MULTISPECIES: LysR family transcriptional regulator [unclassified Caballeronia]EKS70247.1 LysR family transcriptional regulator [Burkholderia sp. SJ98]MCE4546481.1 LysR family transcriptional regulator [Caballeronia sp. PC1]MCE4573045.1 LysR family transcriptional regulator [Caballeronia sp. CLC5]
MDTLQNMRIFARVVEAGGFTAAAQLLKTTTGNASRAVSDLEAHLQTRLLHRTTRRIALTDAGQRYLQRVQEILSSIEQAEAEAGNSTARAMGKLRVHSMTSFGQHHIVPMISQYQEQQPSVQFELTLAQRIPDLLEEGYDMSVILASNLPDSALVSAKLGSIFSIACASPAYIERFGAPKVLADLLHHKCLYLMNPKFTSDLWVFEGPRGQESVAIGPSSLTVNNAGAIENAIRQGMGVGVLPTYSALAGLRTGALVRVLTEYTTLEMNVYALYPSRQYLDAKVRTWLDFLRGVLPETLKADVELLNESERASQLIDRATSV